MKYTWHVLIHFLRPCSLTRQFFTFLQVRGREAAFLTGAQSWWQRYSKWCWSTTSVAAECNGSGIWTTDWTTSGASTNADVAGANGDAEALRDSLYREHCYSHAMLQRRTHIRQQSKDTPDHNSAGVSLDDAGLILFNSINVVLILLYKFSINTQQYIKTVTYISDIRF